MKIAVTGANGFVGSNLVNHLSRSGHDVTALVRANANTSLIPTDVAIKTIDYNDPVSLADALSDAEIAVHNAGKTRTLNYAQMFEANVLITLKVLHAVNQSSSIKRFIYISSQAVSGPSPDMIPKTEDDTPQPVSWYGRSKMRAEAIIKRQCRLPWIIVRPVSVYGEGDHDFLSLFSMVERGLRISIGKAERYINLIHVQQLCRFIESAMLAPQAENEVFFASDGNKYSYDEIIEILFRIKGGSRFMIRLPECLVYTAARMSDGIGHLTGKTPLLNSQKAREMLAPAWLCSIDKARVLLAWQPQTDIIDHLERTYLWYKEHHWL